MSNFDYHVSKFEYKGHTLEIKWPNTGFEYNPNPVYRGIYTLGEGYWFEVGSYNPTEIEDKFKVWLDRRLDSHYDNRVESKRLFDYITKNNPELLSEVIEFLNSLVVNKEENQNGRE